MKRNALGLLIAAALVAGPSLGLPAFAATDAPHGHAHEHGAETPVLSLDHGRKWASDEALRSSMEKIGGVVDSELPAVHEGRMNAARYDALGGVIDAQVANIVQNCKLEPAADGVLHAILAELMEGNAKLQGKSADVERSDGVVQVVRALEQYAQYFEHPGFEAPKAGH